MIFIIKLTKKKLEIEKYKNSTLYVSTETSNYNYINIINNHLNSFNNKNVKYANITIFNIIKFNNTNLENRLIYNIKNNEDKCIFNKIINLHVFNSNNIENFIQEKIKNNIHKKNIYDKNIKLIENEKEYFIRYHKENFINQSLKLKDEFWFNLYYKIPYCSNKRLRQLSGSCWLNSILNSFLLNDDLFNLICKHNKIELDFFDHFTKDELERMLTYDRYTDFENNTYEFNMLNEFKEKNFENLWNCTLNYGNFIEYNENKDLLISYPNEKKIIDENSSKYYKEYFDEIINILTIGYNHYTTQNTFLNNKIYSIKNLLLYIDFLKNNFENVVLKNFFLNIHELFSCENIDNFYYVKLMDKILNDENININIKFTNILILLIDFNLNIKFIIFLKYFEKNEYKLYNNNDILNILSYYIKINNNNHYYIKSFYSNNEIINKPHKAVYFNTFYSEGFNTEIGMSIISTILLNEYINVSNYNYKLNNNEECIKLLYNDNQPIISKENNGYDLVSCIFSLKNYLKNKGHVILGFICNNKYYIYNSNNYIFEFYWCDLNRIQIIIFFFNNLQTILSYVYGENKIFYNITRLFDDFINYFKTIKDGDINKNFYKLLSEVNISINEIRPNINNILKNYHIYNKNENNIIFDEEIKENYNKIIHLKLMINKIIEYINNYIYPNDFYDNIEKINDENNYNEIIKYLNLYNGKIFNDRKINFEYSLKIIIDSSIMIK